MTSRKDLREVAERTASQGRDILTMLERRGFDDIEAADVLRHAFGAQLSYLATAMVAAAWGEPNTFDDGEGTSEIREAAIRAAAIQAAQAMHDMVTGVYPEAMNRMVAVLAQMGVGLDINTPEGRFNERTVRESGLVQAGPDCGHRRCTRNWVETGDLRCLEE